MVMKQTRTPPAHTLAALVGATILAGSLTACDTTATGPEYVGVCVDPNTGMRVDDSFCGVGQPDLMDWVDTTTYPNVILVPVGQRQTFPHTIVIVHAVPSGKSSSTSVPRTGGTASTVRTNIAKTSGGTTSSGSGSGSTSGPGTRSGTGSTSVTRGGLGVKGSTSTGSGSGSTPRVSAGS